MAEGIGLANDLFSAFTPASYGTCRAWFKADALALNDGDAVASWTDSSGNARHATQSTGANKPLFKKNVANGHPALLFDGSNDYLSTASFTARSHPVTVYVVAKRVSGTGSQTMLDGIAVGNQMQVYVEATTGKPQAYSGTALTGLHDIGSGFFLLGVTFNTTSSAIILNDIFQISATTGTQTLTGIRIGADATPSGYWNGYIAEVIYFDGALSVSNDEAVRNYLMGKYAIAYFNPEGLSGLRSRFDAGHIRGLKDGDSVTTWIDTGPTPKDVTQSTAANKPIYKKDIQNHRPVVRFDGSNDYLQSTSFTASAQPHSIFVVCKNDTTAAIRSVMDGIASGNRHTINFQTTGHLLIFAGTGLDSGVDDGLSFLVCSAVFNGGSSAIYKNGTLRVSGAAGSHTLTGYTIGAIYDGTLPFDGDIGEILIYDGALSTTDRQKVEGYLRTKWAI